MHTSRMEILDNDGSIIYAEETYDFEDEPKTIDTNDEEDLECTEKEPWIFYPPKSDCETCWSAVGIYASEPKRPHKHCTCRIEECYDFRYGNEADDALEEELNSENLHIVKEILEYSRDVDIFTAEMSTKESAHKTNRTDKDEMIHFHFVLSQSDVVSEAETNAASFIGSFSGSNFSFGASFGRTEGGTITTGNTTSETFEYDKILKPGQTGFIRVSAFVLFTVTTYYIRYIDLSGEEKEDEAAYAYIEYSHSEVDLIVE